jgi:hypothetical protein
MFLKSLFRKRIVFVDKDEVARYSNLDNARKHFVIAISNLYAEAETRALDECSKITLSMFLNNYMSDIMSDLKKKKPEKFANESMDIVRHKRFFLSNVKIGQLFSSKEEEFNAKKLAKQIKKSKKGKFGLSY